jgi:hypothetical protein
VKGIAASARANSIFAFAPTASITATPAAKPATIKSVIKMIYSDSESLMDAFIPGYGRWRLGQLEG